MDNETVQVLIAVLNTLDNVSVSGRRNVENMRNSMLALERIIEQNPATLRDVSSVLDVNGLNAEIKSGFTKSVVSVEGAAGYQAIDYKVYVLDYANANDAANTYKVTI